MPISVTPDSPGEANSSLHILLVDDSAAARLQVRKSLMGAGMRVSEASEGQEALHKAETNTFDLIVTDMHMPTMDGLVFIRKLRALPKYQRVPVLVLTSDYSKERLKEGREAGATGWLVKPPKVETLVQTIHAAVDRAQ